jgi:hypothetical protein
MLASKDEISSLVKAKDDIVIEFVKAIDQVKERKGLIKKEDDTILKLHQSLDAITLQVSDLCLNGNNTKDVVVLKLEQDTLQCKLDSCALMANTFKNLLAMAKVDHATVLEKNSKAQVAWKRLASKMDVWKQQKFALCTQIQCMKSGRQHPMFNPSPLSKTFMESDVSLILTFNLLIMPCSFCLEGFALSRDCKLASCKHPYHS